MIATTVIPLFSAVPVGYLIADRRSGRVFHPDTGLFLPRGKPLKPADWPPLVTSFKTTWKYATFSPWPLEIGPPSGSGYGLLWADLGTASQGILPGDQLDAYRFGFDLKGAPYSIISGFPTPLSLTVAEASDREGYSLLPVPGITGLIPSAPTTPLPTPTPTGAP